MTRIAPWARVALLFSLASLLLAASRELPAVEALPEARRKLVYGWAYVGLRAAGVLVAVVAWVGRGQKDEGPDRRAPAGASNGRQTMTDAGDHAPPSSFVKPLRPRTLPEALALGLMASALLDVTLGIWTGDPWQASQWAALARPLAACTWGATGIAMGVWAVVRRRG